MTHFKDPAYQRFYDAILKAARDPTSEFYYKGKPHRGAGHRCAFWDGYLGLDRSANVVPRTYSSVAFAAGKAFKKESPNIVDAEMSNLVQHPMTPSRTKFEKWASSKGHDIHHSPGTGYLRYTVQLMWMAWQASEEEMLKIA